MPLTTEEFRAACLALMGPHWQAHLARWLKVNRRTVRKWASGERPLPERVESAILSLTLDREPADHSEWIIGSDPAIEERYLVHCYAPRFIARIVDDDELLAGFAWIMTDLAAQIGLIRWLDPPPPDPDIRTLMAQAEAAYMHYTRLVDAED